MEPHSSAPMASVGWELGAGDPTVLGWLTTLLYTAAAIACGAALWRHRARGWRSDDVLLWAALGGGILLLGTLVFCTSLYIVAFGTKIFGAVAPIGGTAFIVGWLILGFAPLRSDSGESDPAV